MSQRGRVLAQSKRSGRTIGIVASLCIAMLAGLLIPGATASARQQGAEVPSTISVVPVLDGVDSTSGYLIVSVIPGDRVPVSVGVRITVDDDTSFIQTGNQNSPTCFLGEGFVGACGPADATDVAQIAVFRLDVPEGPYEVVRLPFVRGEAGTLPSLDVQVPTLGDIRGLRLPSRIEVGPVAVSSSVQCSPRELLLASSTLTVQSASLVVGDAEFDAAVSVDDVLGGWRLVLDPPNPDRAVLTLATATGSVFTHAVPVNADAVCDADADGVDIPADNCPGQPNESQLDTDRDGIGDVCDTDCDVNGQQITTTLNPAECRALVAFGFSYAGPAVGNACGVRFLGVNCDVAGEHVIGLTFSDITGPPTADIEVFTELRFLSAHDLGLRSLPDELGDLTQLSTLNLSGNLLTDLPDLSRLVALESVNLRSNRFTEIPATLGQLPIRDLSLANNEIDEIDPDRIGGQVTQLDLGNNRLESFPALDRAALRVLALGNNVLDTPPVIDGMPNLYRLFLDGNMIRGDITEFVRTWISEDREFEDGFLQLNDGVGGNECLSITDPDVATAYLAAGLPALECLLGPAVISGRVLDIGGLPLFGVEVCVEGLPARPCGYSLVTGQFEIADVDVSQAVSVSLSATDRTGRFDPTGSAEPFVVAPGVVVEDITLQFLTSGVGGVFPGPEPTPTPTPLPEGGSIAGVIVDAAGLPIANASVCATRVLIGGGGCADSGADGSYQIAGLPVGNYTLEAALNDDVVATFSYVGVNRDQHVVGVDLTAEG